MKKETKWSPVSKEELKAFIGIIIHMGILKLPRIPTFMYWSDDVLSHFHYVRNHIKT